MKDALDKMLAAERQADEIVREAERNAQALLDDAHRRASAIIAQARQTAQQQSEEIITEAVAQARAEKARQLEAITSKIQAEVAGIPDERKEQAARFIVKTIRMDHDV